MNILKKKFLLIALSLLLIFSLNNQVYAGTWGMTQPQNGSAAAAIKVKSLWQYEKTIDLTNNPSDKIPNADFEFVLSEARDEDGIGKVYKHREDDDYDFAVIKKGEIPGGGKTLEFGKVSFKETDVYS